MTLGSPSEILERVNQIKLRALEVWLLLTSCRPRSQDGVLQIAVKAAAVPEGIAGDGVGSHLPQGVPTVLQDVRRRALVALSEGRKGGVLLFTKPRIANLDVVLVLGLTQADVGQVSM